MAGWGFASALHGMLSATEEKSPYGARLHFHRLAGLVTTVKTGMSFRFGAWTLASGLDGGVIEIRGPGRVS